jgi:hypothetical protein
MGIAASALSQTGLKLETTFQTGVTPDILLPWSSCTPKENFGRWEDRSIRGDLSGSVHDVQQGVNHAEITIEGPLYAGGAGGWDAAGPLLYGMFGTDTIAGASPYTHTFSVAAATYALPSWSISDFTGEIATARRFVGCRMNTLTLTFSPAEPVTYSATFIGSPSGSVAKPTLNAPQVDPFMGWETTFNINSAASTEFESFSLEFSRGTAAQHNLNGIQTPQNVNFRGIDCTWSGTVTPADDTVYNRVTNHSQHVMVVTCRSATPTLVFTITQPSEDDATITRSAEDPVKVDISGSTILNSTDSGIMVPVLTNLYDSAYST